MSKCVCDKCGHDFIINQVDFEEIRKGDIIVRYFRCPACLEKYHICTTNPEMRKLIRQRTAIQDKIVSTRVIALPAGTVQELQHKLDRIITRQKKLMPDLKKRGEEILNCGDNTE